MTSTPRALIDRRLITPLANIVGGRRRLGVIAILAGVLALDGADKAAVGAVALQLKSDLHVGNVEIGWLIAASTLVGALTTLPLSTLIDRSQRKRLLVWSIVAWAIALIVSGASMSYSMLLISRLFMGGVVAVAAPAVTSLTGDFFRPGERGRIFSYILVGELFGMAFGFMICGNLAAVTSWRVAFWVLAVAGLGFAWIISRRLREPERGGAGVIGPDSEPDDSAFDHPGNPVSSQAAARSTTIGELDDGVHARGIRPIAGQVVHDDAADWSLWRSIRYVVANRSFCGLMLASALGYFYLSGLRTFAIMFMQVRFDLGQAGASTVSVVIGLGAVIGVIVAGRASDGLIARGRLTGRVLIGAAAYLFAAVVIVPGLLSSTLLLTAPLLFLGAAGVGGTNSPVDAARLDVMHWGLWGRAEGVRATLRYVFEAAAAPAFGYSVDLFDAWHGPTSERALGLRDTLLVMLVFLVGAGLLLMLRVRKTYLRDVATALASTGPGQATLASAR